MIAEKLLVVLRGLSGSGKTMFAEMISSLDSTNVKKLSLDDYRIVDGKYLFHKDLTGKSVKQLRADLVNYLESSIKIIILDNTHTRLSEFSKETELAETYGYKVIVINTEYNDFDLLCQRRNDGEKSIPKAKMEWMRDRWEYLVNPKPLSWYTYRIGKFFRKIKRSISGGRKTA